MRLGTACILLAALMLFRGVPGAQDTAPDPGSAGKETLGLSRGVNKAELEDHVCYLTSDALKGRLPGSEGYRAASSYVAGQLSASGLAPTMASPEGGRTYFQDIKFTISTIAAQSLLLIKKADRELHWKIGEQFIPLLHNQAFRNGFYEGNVVFVGYGIEETGHGWNDYGDRDVSGKIVMLYIGTPVVNGTPVLPEEQNTYYGSIMQSLMKRLRAAFHHKARGVMIIPDPQTSTAWPMLSAQMNRPLRRLKENAQENDTGHLPVFLIRPEAAAELFRETDFDPVSGTGSIQSTHIGDVKITFNLKYEIAEEFACRNVVGLIPGSDPVLKDEYIVVSAHLDHLGMEESEVFNGANDNASGCAAVLEAAKAVAMSSPKRSVYFIFSTGEEGAGQGSYHFINNFPSSLDKIKLAINVDMIGRDSPEYPSSVLGVAPDHLKHQLGSFMVKANEAGADINLTTSLSGVDFGDYYGSGDEGIFMLKGIPAVLITGGFGWPDYHQTSDDPDKIDYEKVSDAARLVVAMVTLSANSDLPF